MNKRVIRNNKDITLNHYLRLFVFAFLLLMVFLVPIAQPIFLKLHDISEIPKVTLIRVLGSFALLLWAVWTYILNKRLRLPPKIVSAGIFLFLISWGLSTIFSTNFYLSFFGSYMRQMGFLTYFFYFATFFLLYDVIETHTELRYFYWTIVITTVVVDFFGALQLYRLMPWYERVRTESRIISTLGHADFLGHFLVMVMPLILALIYQVKNLCLKISLYFLFLLSFLVLLGSYTRGAWVAFLVGIIFYYAFVLLKEKKFFTPKNKIITLALVLGLGFTVGIFYISETKLYLERKDVGLFSLKERFESIGAGLGVTQQNPRVLTWRDSVRLFEDKILKSPRIIYGLGPETFSFNFTPYKSLDLARYDRGKGYPDREHNEFLDILFPQGLFGLFSFIFIIVSVFFYSIKNYHHINPENRILFLGALTGWISFLVQGLVLFGLSATYLYFWILTAFIMIFFKLEKKDSVWEVSLSSLARLFILILCIFVSIFSIKFSLQFFRAEIYYRYGLDYINSGEVGRAAAILEEAIKLRPQETAFHEAVIKAYLGIMGGAEDEDIKKEAFIKGESHIKGLLENAYYKSLTYNLVGAFYAQAYHYLGRKDETLIKKAEEYLNEALSYDRYCVPPMENLLKMYSTDLKNEEKALEIAERILEIDSYHVEAASYAAKFYFQEGDFEKAKEIYERLLSINPNDKNILFNLGLVMYRLGDLNKAEEYLLKSLNIDPTYSNALELLRVIYKQLGKEDKLKEIKIDERVYIQRGLEAYKNKDYNSAFDYFKKALELKPNSPEIMNNIGAVLFMSGRYDEAILWFKKALETKKDYVQAYGNLVYAYLQKGDLFSAEVVLNEGLKYAPNDANLRELKNKLEELKKERRQ
ncbi:MAG: tetratricopeptide repeat protein [Dictyoglomus sp.]